MGKLNYLMITSLDGYISDRDGNFDWGTPDAEFHEFINEHMRSIGTYLYGRKMYEAMVYWETAHTLPDQPPFALEFARIWKAADKIVYSTTLNEAASERTRIERTFDPEAVRKLKAESESDLYIAGPQLAAHAIRAGLVDEYQFFAMPVIIGGGNPFFPDGVRVPLDLLEERRLDDGIVYLRYGVKAGA